MKYYVHIENEIIVSVNENTADPVESKNRAIIKLSNDSNFMDLNTKLKSKIKTLHKYHLSLKKKSQKNKPSNIDIIKLKSDIKKTSLKIKGMIEDSVNNTIVYMNLPRNSIGINTEEEYKSLLSKLASLKSNENININFEVVKDFRGIKYWDKNGDIYTEHTVEKLNETLPDSAITVLSKKDIENIVKQKMTTEDKVQLEYSKYFSLFLKRIFENESDEFLNFQKLKQEIEKEEE